MGLQMILARKIAAKYGVAHTRDEMRMFAVCWQMRKQADEYGQARADEIQAEVAKAFNLLRRGVDGKSSTAKGHHHVKRLPVTGRYVVFSDHHWSFEGHRQNFFLKSGNQSLYRAALRQYLEAGYTLVENGDVEELLVMEPTLTEMKRRQAMNWAELKDRRLGYRLYELKRIVDDPKNESLYRMIGEFHDKGRYVKIAGNHDHDIQRDECLALLRQRLPGIPAPYDYLFLEGAPAADGTKPVRWAILHGHQFDTATNPRFAPYIGELISETLSWAYQGADRIWRWNDQVRDWALGRVPFRNSLVTDDYDHRRSPALDGIGAVFTSLHDPDAWEGLFKHNIAWEYFENDDPQKAVNLEVMTGDEFFKFRHLDERFIRQQLLAKFVEGNRPFLVLGHSHEVRFRPSVSEDQSRGAFDLYFNSGAAGRFENLIWGLEIVNGEPTLISWNRPEDGQGKPSREGSPERHVYTNQQTANGNRLWASKEHKPLA